MNKFLNQKYPKFNSFKEHIKFLEGEIKDSEEAIEEIKDEINSYKKEIEETKKLEVNINNNIEENYKPTIYLDGWKDSEEKKKLVYDWCQAHEIIHHPELVGNYFEGERMHQKYKTPGYNFITASSDTSKIRYVRCEDCYRRNIEEGIDIDCQLYMND